MASSSSQQEHRPFSGIEAACERGTPCIASRLYQVFINHRGPDVKQTVALPLYNSFQELGFQPFLDSQELELGDSIPSTLYNAICSASAHIAIFSKRYAESAWCLAELELIVKSNVKIVPVFYDVAPSDLRYVQKGKGVYAAAFSEHKEKGRYLNKLEEWKTALHRVSFISGCKFDSRNGNPIELCKNIVGAVIKEAEKTNPLHVARHSVCLNQLVEEFEMVCQKRAEGKVNIVGIFGMGGSGKTTLAKELFNLKRSEYNGSCFLFDVREASAKGELPGLQSKLLKDLVNQDLPKILSIHEGTSHLNYHMGRSAFLRFLIVIDDIDHVKQLDALLIRDALNSGSLVIVTTRDDRVLIQYRIALRFKMKTLNRDHARELFCWHAFSQPYPAVGFEDLVECFVEACGGLPLSLQVVGSHVCGGDKPYWQGQLTKIRKTLPGEVRQTLKISIDALDMEEKQIFMDIACFFISHKKSMAIRIWNGSGWNAEHTVKTLIDKCLISIQVNYDLGDEEQFHYVFRMHDHLRDLGREIADEQSNPSRLWRPGHLKKMEHMGIQNILVTTRGKTVRCLHTIQDDSVGFGITYFIGNANECTETKASLLWLNLHLQNVGNNKTTIPLWFPLQNLQGLTIYQGCLERLWQRDMQASNFQLKELKLYRSSVEVFPYSSLGMLSHLEKLVLIGRGDASNSMQIEGRSFSESLRTLNNLSTLVLKEITVNGELVFNNSSESTSFESSLKSLKKIDITFIKNLKKVSISKEHCPALEYIQLAYVDDLIELDLILNCFGLRSLNKLKTVSRTPELTRKKPSEELEMSSFKRITINGCCKLQNITGIENLERLNSLLIYACNGAIPNHIQNLQKIPSEFMSVIGRADEGAESTLNAHLFSHMLGTNSVCEFFEYEKRYESLKLTLPESLSAVIICAVVECPFLCTIEHLPNFFSRHEEEAASVENEVALYSSMEKGKWIITTILTNKEKINYRCNDISQKDLPWNLVAWDNAYFGRAKIKKGCVVTMKEGDERKALNVFKTIIAQLYQGIQ